MKKILVIAIPLIIVICVSALIYLNSRNRTLSPPASTALTQGDLSVSVQYSRPSVRNRVVFGTKEEKALQPYGEYWRLGANESTEINFNTSVLFNGKPVKSGRYRIYAYPGVDTFELVLNSELGVWGVFDPDEEEDVVHTKVPVERLTIPVEQFTVNMQPAGDTIHVQFEWERVRFTVPVLSN